LRSCSWPCDNIVVFFIVVDPVTDFSTLPWLLDRGRGPCLAGTYYACRMHCSWYSTGLVIYYSFKQIFKNRLNYSFSLNACISKSTHLTVFSPLAALALHWLQCSHCSAVSSEHGALLRLRMPNARFRTRGGMFKIILVVSGVSCLFR